MQFKKYVDQVCEVCEHELGVLRPGDLEILKTSMEASFRELHWDTLRELNELKLSDEKADKKPSEIQERLLKIRARKRKE